MTEEYEAFAKNITCPYTGAGLKIDFHFCAGRPSGFFLKGNGFDPNQIFLDRSAAEQSLKQRAGGRSVNTLVCPYSGKRIELVNVRDSIWKAQTKDGSQLFSPTLVWERKEDLIYAASFKNGKTKLQPPPEKPRVVVVEKHEDGGVPDIDPAKHSQGVSLDKIKGHLEEIL